MMWKLLWIELVLFVAYLNAFGIRAERRLGAKGVLPMVGLTCACISLTLGVLVFAEGVT